MKKNVYIAACDANGGIYHYTLEDGKLSFVRKYDVDRPMWLTIDGNRMFVLLRELTDNLNSGVMAFDILSDGSLANPTAPVLSGGRCACHSCVSGDRLYVVNYLSGNICAFDKNNLGKGIIAEDTHTGHGVHPKRQEAPHTHFTRETPDGKYVFCVDLGLDTIFVYDKDLKRSARAKSRRARAAAISTIRRTGDTSTARTSSAHPSRSSRMRTESLISLTLSRLSRRALTVRTPRRRFAFPRTGRRFTCRTAGTTRSALSTSPTAGSGSQILSGQRSAGSRRAT